MGFFDKPEVISPGGDGERARVAELEQRVARLEAQLAQLLAQGPPSTSAGGAGSPPATAYWMADVQALKSGGKVIHAIKLYRERTGVGLKEAKDAVDAMPD
jgi:ribosomal protein L7/L12